MYIFTKTKGNSIAQFSCKCLLQSKTGQMGTTTLIGTRDKCAGKGELTVFVLIMDLNQMNSDPVFRELHTIKKKIPRQFERLGLSQVLTKNPYPLSPLLTSYVYTFPPCCSCAFHLSSLDLIQCADPFTLSYYPFFSYT